METFPGHFRNFWLNGKCQLSLLSTVNGRSLGQEAKFARFPLELADRMVQQVVYFKTDHEVYLQDKVNMGLYLIPTGINCNGPQYLSSRRLIV